MLAIDVDEYERQSGLPGLEGLAPSLAALSAAGLIEERGKTLTPTPKGMFYADAVASLLLQKNEAVARREHTAPRFSRTRESDHVSNMAEHM
jgi:coproporphyrinogen III oxidase-like Fe-S oxidoreductase